MYSTYRTLYSVTDNVVGKANERYKYYKVAGKVHTECAKYLRAWEVVGDHLNMRYYTGARDIFRSFSKIAEGVY